MGKRHVVLMLLHVELDICLIPLCAALGFRHAGIHKDLSLWSHWGLGLELLQLLHHLLDDRHDLLESLYAVLVDVLAS